MTLQASCVGVSAYQIRPVALVSSMLLQGCVATDQGGSHIVLFDCPDARLLITALVEHVRLLIYHVWCGHLGLHEWSGHQHHPPAAPQVEVLRRWEFRPVAYGLF